MNGTFVKLFRDILQWGWYTDYKTCRLFTHLLLKASIFDTTWKGIKIKRGQLPTSYKNLARETGLSVQNVRTSINRLKSTHEVTCQSTRDGTMITVVNYSDYQDVGAKGNKVSNTPPNNEVTRLQHASNTQVTTYKNSKESKNVKNVKNKTFSPPSVADVAAYCLERNKGIDSQQFVDFYTSKGWYVGNRKMVDWKASVRTWEKNGFNKTPKKQKETPYDNLF